LQEVLCIPNQEFRLTKRRLYSGNAHFLEIVKERKNHKLSASLTSSKEIFLLFSNAVISKLVLLEAELIYVPLLFICSEWSLLFSK